jgi:hypothetical protein
MRWVTWTNRSATQRPGLIAASASYRSVESVDGVGTGASNERIFADERADGIDDSPRASRAGADRHPAPTL